MPLLRPILVASLNVTVSGGIGLSEFDAGMLGIRGTIPTAAPDIADQMAIRDISLDAISTPVELFLDDFHIDAEVIAFKDVECVDVAFAENSSRIRKGRGLEVAIAFRRLALSTIKASLRGKRLMARLE